LTIYRYGSVVNLIVNPAITMMALTARACAYIAEEMRKGNL
jgi:hypothetical protein